jgi:hypothetical protein
MNFYPRGFNLYLLAAAVVLSACGCASYFKKDRHLSVLRIHIENRAQLPGSSLGKNVKVLRAQPVTVDINTEPVLTEADLVDAELLTTPGGFAVQVHVTETAALTLEQYTGSYVGRHFVVFGQWSDKREDSRWLAAPIISHRISDGTFAFTPDCSEEEARLLVIGLNNVAKKLGQQKDK